MHAMQFDTCYRDIIKDIFINELGQKWLLTNDEPLNWEKYQLVSLDRMQNSTLTQWSMNLTAIFNALRRCVKQERSATKPCWTLRSRCCLRRLPVIESLQIEEANTTGYSELILGNNLMSNTWTATFLLTIKNTHRKYLHICTIHQA